MTWRATSGLRALGLAAVLAAGTAVALGRPLSSRSVQPDSPLVAFRYDTGRVVFVVGSLSGVYQRDLEALPELPAPEARLSALQLYRADLENVPGAADIAGWFDDADRWSVDTGRERVRAKIERFAPALRPCEAVLAAIAAVEPGDRARFDRVREKYFLVQRDTESGLPPPAGPISLSAPDPPLTELERLGVEDLLKEALGEELARVRKGDSYDWSGGPSWRALDARLARAEGDLRFDSQMLRATPDGVARLYVRASWVLDNRIVFLMSAWIRRGARLNAEAVNSRPSTLLRMRIFQSTPFSREWLGLLLNVFDRDGDGWAEILITSWGYESAAFELFEYSESGPQPTGITYAHGC